MSILEVEDLFLSLRQLVVHTPVFPYLWLPHCIMMNLALRATLGHGNVGLLFARRHPLSTFLLAILYTFPGGIISSLLLSQPLLSFLAAQNNFYTFLAAWYLIFYSPLDLLYKSVMAVPSITIAFTALQDWLRISLVASGVSSVLALHPNTFIYPVIIGTLKSSGFMFLKYAEHIAMNGWTKAFVLPHHSTKTMILAACLLTSHKLGHFPSCSWDTLYTVIVLGAVVVRLVTSFIYKNWDPYFLLETQVRRFIYGREDLEEEASKIIANEEKENLKEKEDGNGKIKSGPAGNTRSSRSSKKQN